MHKTNDLPCPGKRKQTRRKLLITALVSAVMLFLATSCNSGRTHGIYTPAQPEQASTPAPLEDKPDSTDTAPEDPNASLPQVAETGAMPTVPALLDCIDELKRGNPLNNARLLKIKRETSKPEKKATMGAMIDLLIKAVHDNDRNSKRNISDALYDVWNTFVIAEWGEEEMVYTISFDGQSTSDLPLRRWLEVYNSYKTD